MGTWASNITKGLLYVFLSQLVSCPVTKLYYDGDKLSPPTRAVLMALEILKTTVEEKTTLEYISLSLPRKEHMTTEFFMMNPEHTVPVIEEENNFYVYGNLATLMYLIDKYKRNDDLYPHDADKRAIIDQRLYLDTYFMFYYEYKLDAHESDTVCLELLCDKQKEKVLEAYDLIEIYLEETPFLASASATIADLAVITHVTTLKNLIPLDEKNHTRTLKWVSSMESKDYMVKHNAEGAKKFAIEIEEFFGNCIIPSTTASTAASDTIPTNSDTTHITGDTTSITSDTTSVTSDTTSITSDTTPITSETTTTTSDTTATT